MTNFDEILGFFFIFLRANSLFYRKNVMPVREKQQHGNRKRSYRGRRKPANCKLQGGVQDSSTDSSDPECRRPDRVSGLLPGFKPGLTRLERIAASSNGGGSDERTSEELFYESGPADFAGREVQPYEDGVFTGINRNDGGGSVDSCVIVAGADGLEGGHRRDGADSHTPTDGTFDAGGGPSGQLPVEQRLRTPAISKEGIPIIETEVLHDGLGGDGTVRRTAGGSVGSEGDIAPRIRPKGIDDRAKRVRSSPGRSREGSGDESDRGVFINDRPTRRSKHVAMILSKLHAIDFFKLNNIR